MALRHASLPPQGALQLRPQTMLSESVSLRRTAAREPRGAPSQCGQRARCDALSCVQSKAALHNAHRRLALSDSTMVDMLAVKRGVGEEGK
eukprot:1004593-Rhodomonas_salina.1